MKNTINVSIYLMNSSLLILIAKFILKYKKEKQSNIRTIDMVVFYIQEINIQLGK